MSDTRTEAWNKLTKAAADYAAPGGSRDGASPQALGEAAKAWAVANGYALKSAAPQSTKGVSGFVMPFGRSKGKPIESEPVKGLQYLAKYLEESVADPAKAKWAEKNQELLDAVNAELEKRA